MSFSGKKLTAGDFVLCLFVGIFSLICLAPFVYVFAISFTHHSAYVPLKFYLIPAKWSLENYRYLLSTRTFLDAISSTAYVTVIGTFVNLFVTFTFAYGLTRRSLPGQKFFTMLTIFTMLFSAGIVPFYMLIKDLHLINSLWALILSTATSAWNIIVVRSFMMGIPEELQEAAKIDGSSDIGIFLRIILPLSLPCLASFTLLFAVAHWNTYFNAMLFITDSTKWTLQLLVKSLIVDAGSQNAGMQGATDSAMLPQEPLRMAAVMIAMLPILVLYPFLQRYFVSGLTLGGVKG